MASSQQPYDQDALLSPSSSWANGPSQPEDWSNLRLATNSLHRAPPIVGERSVYPTFTRELVRVQWRGGDPIDLYIMLPTGVKNPPVVLYLYSYPSDTDRFLNNTLCEKLTRNGFAAVGFVSALTGQRYHDRPFREWFVSELEESLASSTHDVQMILNYLDDRGDVDMHRVGIFGQGSGGAIAILSASVDPRIRAVDVLDPWGDWPDWLAQSPQIPAAERARYTVDSFLHQVAPLDPVVWLPQLDRPLRVQEALFNQAIPAAVRQKMERAIPKEGQLVEYEDLNIYREKVSQDGRMLDWLRQRLETDPKPKD